MSPLLSVVLSVHNGEKHLKAAIESILGQTFDDFEFIIIDDASTDQSSSIIDSYATKDSRIKVIKNEVNLGLTKSLNKGIGVACGKYIARQDADDISAPERLEKLFNYLKSHQKCVLVASDVEAINDDGDFERYYHYSSDDLKTKLMKGNHFTHGSVGFLKEAFNLIGGYREAFKYAQDYDLFARLSEKNEIGYINEYLYKWRNSREGISNNKLLEQLKYTVLIRCFIKERLSRGSDSYAAFAARGFEAFLKDYKYRDFYYYYYGRALFSLNQFSKAREAFRRGKGFPDKYILIVLSFMGQDICAVIRRFKWGFIRKTGLVPGL